MEIMEIKEYKSGDISYYIVYGYYRQHELALYMDTDYDRALEFIKKNA